MAAHLRLPALLVFLAMLGGCETSLGPYAPSNRHFSIFGVLNVASDRHWVRVEALRDGRPIGADSTLDAAVILTHLESGRQVTMKDSLFSYEGELAHNFYGEMDLQLEHTYRLVARSSEGEASTATVTMPHSIPEVSLSERGTTATIEGGTEDRFLFLTVLYHVFVDPTPPLAESYHETFTVQYAERAMRTGTGYSASLNWIRDVRSFYSGGDDEALVTLLEVEVQVGLVHPSAPGYDGLSYEDLFRPGVAPSNVENGAGYLAGLTNDRASVTLPSDERPQMEVP